MTSCSLSSRAAAESLPGTAPVARAWIILEHPGPWGRDAVADSDLPDSTRQALASAKGLGIGVLLARHPDRRGESSRMAWLARSVAGGMRMRETVLDDIRAVEGWDLVSLATGRLPAVGETTGLPLLLVCTHSKRDQCCAVHGRTLAAALLESPGPMRRDRIWECSHIGGHRFAPVSLTLPSGLVHGRLADVDTSEIVEAAARNDALIDSLRGRSCFPEPMQAAEIAVRRLAGIRAGDVLDVLLVSGERVLPVELGWAVPIGSVLLEVRHVDGRSWRVTVAHESTGAERAESCGKDPLPVHSWVASGVTPVADWTSRT